MSPDGIPENEDARDPFEQEGSGALGFAALLALAGALSLGLLLAWKVFLAGRLSRGAS